MLPEHVGTGDFILSPQVLKGEGFAFLPPLLAILLWVPLIPAYPGLPRSDLGSFLHRQQWLLMSVSSLKAGLKKPCSPALSTDFAPGTVRSALHTASHFIVAADLRERSSYTFDRQGNRLRVVTPLAQDYTAY